MIQLENIYKSYPSAAGEIQALRGISLGIDEGQIYGIIGFSGAGKSTLVRVMNLLERPDSGRVIVNGAELTALTEKELRAARKKIGMIFQQFNLFASRTVAENVAFPLQWNGLGKKEQQERVTSLLELVDLADKRDAYPSQLSGGQKQRVAIARALANDPKILLCDEATSALDPQTTLSILGLLKRLNRELGLTIVVITHEMQVVKEICARVAVMEQGELIEEGDVFSIFASPAKKVTADFVDAGSSLSRLSELIRDKSPLFSLRTGECLLRLKYLRKSVSEALVSTISRRFNVDVNIICGNIELVGNSPVGGLAAVVSGEASDVHGAIQYLREKNVGVEVLLDARITERTDSERCGKVANFL